MILGAGFAASSTVGVVLTIALAVEYRFVGLALILEAIWSQLVAEDLVESDSLATENAFEVDPSRGHQVHVITQKGSRFLRYLANHPDAEQSTTVERDGR